jgi:hypothetical protein
VCGAIRGGVGGNGNVGVDLGGRGDNGGPEEKRGGGTEEAARVVEGDGRHVVERGYGIRKIEFYTVWNGKTVDCTR